MIHEYTQRDKYGRTVLHLEAAVPNVPKRATVVMVTLPKVYAAEYGHRYLVNDWSAGFTPGASDAENGITYFVKRAEALAHARAKAQAAHDALAAQA